ncbi:3-dehydroquinate synthase [Taibaiella koreensis]|uniref:3-dehydroquinate synthase n=1 Tax=Taibaiella koreensis TaxID=1268548 RepID=UPI000E59D4D1|nr:3-dehydroquinate synthase [Taibaiella koreensis]
MIQETIAYTSASTALYFDASLEKLKELAPTANSFILTDENLMMHYQQAFKPWQVITVPAGESAKTLDTLDDVIRQLIALDAGRDATLIGIGGGVVTDIAGFAAGIYKRGIRCGFVPSSVLGMIDAAIGGKNGLDIGEYKNMMGLVRQPEFILYDYALLDTLPEEEWICGFAEVIKHAAIKDKEMFALLEQHTLADFRNDKALLADLIYKNVLLKATVVREDEWENGDRKLLNFGHTLGHAIENSYELSHGQAISIGMVFAARVSESCIGFKETGRLIALLEKYELPVQFPFDSRQALHYMMADKKKIGEKIGYVLLETIGSAVVHPLSIDEIRTYLNS